MPGEFTEDLWVEKIKLDTRPPLDRDQLKQGRDFLGDLLRSIDEAAADDSALDALGAQVQKLATKVRAELAEDEIDFSSRSQLAAWLRRAEDDLLSRLTEQGA
jgi:hypothetical protein